MRAKENKNIKTVKKKSSFFFNCFDYYIIIKKNNNKKLAPHFFISKIRLEVVLKVDKDFKAAYLPFTPV